MKFTGLTFVLLSVLTACGAGTPGGTGVPANTADPAACVSGSWWNGGNEGSSLMRPGGDCVGCHANGGEAPRYELGGTVYTNLGEPNDCYGVNSAVVVITDANGVETRLNTNQAGNFSIGSQGSSFAYPYTASVEYNGNVVSMVTPQTDGNCANCHTSSGANGAAGRVVAP